MAGGGYLPTLVKIMALMTDRGLLEELSIAFEENPYVDDAEHGEDNHKICKSYLSPED